MYADYYKPNYSYRPTAMPHLYAVYLHASDMVDWTLN